MPRALRFSLFANAALAIVVAVQLGLHPASPPAASAASVAQPDTAPSPAAPAAAPGPEASAPGGIRDALRQLEQLGLPREVVVNALLGDIHRRWDRRVAELEERYAPRSVPTREYIELARQRDAEQERELVAARGAEGHLAWDKARILRLHNAGNAALNPAEADTVYRLQKDFDAHIKELQMAVEDGVADPTDSSALHSRAQAALDEELRRLLGPQRYDQLRGLSDPVTDAARRYGALNPTPAQAQSVVQTDDDYRTRETALARRLKEDPGAVDIAAELKVLNEAREENLRRIFGAAAYENTRRETDSTYQRLDQFAEAWELRSEELPNVYETLRTFGEQMELTRSAAAMREAAGQRVNWNEVNATIEQARRQTETGLEQLIGAKRAWRLKENGLLSTR